MALTTCRGTDVFVGAGQDGNVVRGCLACCLNSLIVANAGPADSQSTAISAAPVVHLRDMVWQCDAVASTAACPSPAEGSASLAAVLDIPAGTQVAFILTATLEGQGGEEASLAAGATPSSQESDGHPENNHATAQVSIRGALLSDGFESR